MGSTSPTRYSPWADLASRADIVLEWAPLVGRLGEYVHAERLIRIVPDLARRQLRCVLAHELVHAEQADRLTQCSRVNLRQEQEADRKAAKRLIDIHELALAMMVHGNHLSAMAVELGVTDRLMRVRRDGLTRTERLYLQRRLRDGVA